MLGVNTPALPASLRRTNQRTVLSLLLRLGCASKADLAKTAGISQPTAGKITSELLKLGLLQEVETPELAPENGDTAAPPKLGRPGQLLRLDRDRPRFLAIEIGVKETKVAALPVAVELQDRWDVQFPTPTTPEAWSKALKRAADPLCKPTIWGVLASVPGIVSETEGKVLFSPNLHWLENTDLRSLLGRAWELPVSLVQEIRALALGHLTAEPGEDFFLVDFGQGVGGAIVLDGQLYANPMPLSGEFGHTPVAGNHRRCGCGAVGCLETLVSENGLIESFSQATGKPRSWARLVDHVKTVGLEPWLTSSLAATATVISGALNVLGLHRLVVTGVLTQISTETNEFLTSEVQKGAMWARFGRVECQIAPRRRAAGLVAAGLDRLVLPEGNVALLNTAAKSRKILPEDRSRSQISSVEL